MSRILALAFLTALAPAVGVSWQGEVVGSQPDSVKEPTIAQIYAARYSAPLPPPLEDEDLFFLPAQHTEISLEVLALYASASTGLGWYTSEEEYLLIELMTVGLTFSFIVGPDGFGLWLQTTWGGVISRCYSDPELNDGVDRLLVYDTPVPNEYFLAWEDCASYDGDFNDVVLIGTHFAPISTQNQTWSELRARFR